MGYRFEWTGKSAIAGLMMVLLACGGVRINRSMADPSFRMPRDSPIYVTLARDGEYGGILQPGSGRAVSRALSEVLSYHNPRVSLAEGAEGAAEALESANALGAAFIVAPEVVSWENRATNWSGKPDRVQLLIRVLRVPGGRPLDATTIRIEGPSVVDLGANGPGALLHGALADYAEQLF